MKTLQSQRRFAVLWIFVFVVFQALGRPLHVWSGCSQVCGTGSNCCVLDASHLETRSSSDKSVAAQKKACSHCHVHKHAGQHDRGEVDSKANRQSEGERASDDLQWSAEHCHECTVCQWFSTPSLSAPEFTLRDAGNVVFPIDLDRPIQMAASVSTDQSPRGPPQ
jgi:hypothetical protein